MPALSDYLEQNLLDEVFNKVDFTGPSTYIALFTTPLGDDGTGGTEVSGGAYARVQVHENGSVSTPKWNLAAAEGEHYVVDNAGEVAFAEATADWGMVKGFGVYDAASSGNLLYHGPLASSPVPFCGLATDDTLYAKAHGRSNDERVVFKGVDGRALPSGLSENTEYYVINATTDNFQVSASQGGAAVTLSADGDGLVFLSKWQDVRTGNTLKFAAGDFDCRLGG
jgi:hypothetical protein